MVYLLQMVIFHSYVKLPEGTWIWHDMMQQGINKTHRWHETSTWTPQKYGSPENQWCICCCGGKWCVRTNASSTFPVLFGNDWSIAIFSWPARGWTDVGKVVQMRLSTALKMCTCHAEFLNFSGEIIHLVGSTPMIFVVCGGRILNPVRKEPCGVLSTQWAAEHLGASDHRISHLHVLPRLGRKCGAESFLGPFFLRTNSIYRSNACSFFRSFSCGWDDPNTSHSWCWKWNYLLDSQIGHRVFFLPERVQCSWFINHWFINTINYRCHIRIITYRYNINKPWLCKS